MEAVNASMRNNNVDPGMVNSKVFLQMLMKEMQNQDPTEPTDTNKTLQQMYNLSSLSQTSAMNTNIAKLVQMHSISNHGIRNAVHLLHKNVEFDGSISTSKGGEVKFNFDVKGEPKYFSSIKIYDMSGNLVHKVDNMEMLRNNIPHKGKNTYAFPCSNDNEQYKIVVDTQDWSNKKINVSYSRSGIVNAVYNVNGKVYLEINGALVDQSQIDKVKLIG